MDLELILLALLVTVWAGLGAAAWLAAATVRRGRGVLAGLPLAMVGGIGGGVLPVAAGARDVAALLLSLGAALVGGFALALVGIRIHSKMRRHG